MVVDGYFQFLVTVLGIFLAIFLLLSIAFLVKAIQIANQLKEITAKAQSLVDKAEHIGEILGKAAAPAAAARFLSGVVDFVRNKGGKKERHGK